MYSVPAPTATSYRSAIDGLAAPGLLADLLGQEQPLEGELDGPRTLAVVGGLAPVADVVVQLGLTEHREPAEELDRGDLLAGGDGAALLDRADQEPEVEARESRAHGLGGRPTGGGIEDPRLAALLAGLELDLAPEDIDRCLQVDHPGDGGLLAPDRRAVQRCGGDRLRSGDGEACGHTRALVDRARLAQG